MEPIKFKYSKPQMIYSILKLMAWTALGYWIINDLVSKNGGDIPKSISKLILPAFVSVFFMRLIYLSVYFYIPCLRGDVALELDEQKLTYNIRGQFLLAKTKENIYWKELRSLSYDSFRNMDMVRIKMMPGDKLVLPIQNVAGSSNLIFDKIKEYFQKYG